jgi:hypothetical protein
MQWFRGSLMLAPGCGIHPEAPFLTLRFEPGQRQELLELLCTRPIVDVDTEGPELTFEGR